MDGSSPRSPRDEAVADQLAASDPAVSAFVEASAGSGKTKLLTDRMLRLMLAGAPPGRIQCLTFTKAAAAEMALRLQDRLGRWAVIDDVALDAELAALRVQPGPAARSRARALFADVLDLPGGMKIGTIHAFCQSLLRRFPLEAAISPHFRLIEDTDARMAMQAAREAVLERAAPMQLQGLAGAVDAATFARRIEELDAVRDRLAPLLSRPELGIEAAVRRAAGAVGTDDQILDAALDWPAAREVARVLQIAKAHGSKGVQDTAGFMLGLLGLPPALRREHWDQWLEKLLTQEGKPRAPSAFAAKVLAERHPDIHAVMQAEQARVLEVEDARRAVRLAGLTSALLQLAAPMLRAYAERKRQGGMLDYADLIGRSSGLLQDPGAAWVLYKLDGGIDHLLLDEVQDTAPEQWEIAHKLTEEFFAGLGAHSPTDAPGRTFFAVGDPKQSIYSFQGADPDEFARSRGQMARRVGEVWRDVTLHVSFRSAPPVLALVDAVFADPLAGAGVADGEILHHRPDRAGAAGRVELWPLAPLPEEAKAPDWTVPERNMGLVSAPQRLGDALADWIAAQISGGAMLESRGRPLHAGDVLVLVRRRTDFARNLVRALKARGVPVAGLDRLELTAQAAVQDVLAACDAVLLPQDDLAVSCVLTSPLGGLDDESLMALALGRQGRLWDALRGRAGERPEWQQAWDFLAALQSRADHATPYALLAEALGRLGGRARLLARLGPEAAEPLDELLNAALAYTQGHPPSLQGFVHWLRRSGAMVKREAGGAGGAVRVMTVHGAKGLQAPLVILPDTTSLPPDDEPFSWTADPQTGVAVPLWAPQKAYRCAAVDRARVAAKERRVREYNRLLYVALTRAEDRLVVCGWATKKAQPEGTWFNMVARGMALLEDGKSETFTGPWPGAVAFLASEQRDAVLPSPGAEATAAAPLPHWAGRPGAWQAAPPPAEPAVPQPLVPSRPDNVLLGPVPGTRSPLAAAPAQRFQAGSLAHALLQHLPSLPASGRLDAARAELRRQGMAAAAAAELAGQVIAVLDHPELAELFGPQGRPEQPVTGLVAGTAVTGIVDRLAVLPDKIRLADYKTGRQAPARVEDTPALYLRQLAAYRAVLAAAYPDRPVHCALVWTQGAQVVAIPPALLDAHAPGA